MQENKVLRKNPNMVTRVIEDETILLPIYRSSNEINCIYTLNKSASRVWELINGKRTIAQIKKQILKEFDSTAEEVEKEMNNLLKDLLEIKAIK
ncbi:MAG: PqqD family protein [Candidatus Omnitrophica bacterium]|nr:PqqD family protein [Candidatus Omnitrophota bacterium]